MKKKFTVLKMQGDEWRPHKHSMMILCGMGIPMGLQYSITAIGSVILQTAVNTLGSVAVASVTAGGKIGTFFCCPFDAMGATMATYGGQNVGAKKLDRISRGLRDCVLLGAIYSVIAFVVIYFFSDVIALLFVDASETEILHNTRTFLLAKCIVLFPAGVGKYRSFHDSGTGVFQTGHSGRCLRDDCQVGGCFLAGSGSWLRWSMSGESGSLDRSRSVPNSGISPCDEAFEICGFFFKGCGVRWCGEINRIILLITN